MRVLDIFSGIGGFSLGLERVGMKTVRFVEIDPFCRRVLAKHWPDVPCDDDVTKAEFREGEADVICGGFPCQDVSRAGHRAGITGRNSGLYRELVRAIRLVRPEYAILENVAALLGDGMGDVCGELAESGYNLEWDCVPACAIGAPHERDRIWIVAHASELPRSKRCEFEEIGRWQEKAEQIGVGIGDASNANNRNNHENKTICSGRNTSEHDSSKFIDSQGGGCGQGRAWRPPDSFSRVRNQTRGNIADAECAGLENGNAKAARNSQSESSRENFTGCWKAWPDEPALCGVDDGIPYLVDRVKALGNSLLPQIPEMIGRAIMESRRD